MAKDFKLGSDISPDTSRDLGNAAASDFGGDLANEDGVDLNTQDDNIADSEATGVNKKGSVAKAMVAPPPPDYSHMTNFNNESAIYCDAPDHIGRSLEDQFPDLKITYEPSETEELKPGHQEIDPFNYAEELGSGFKDIQDSKNQNNENEELNNALQGSESADNCDPPEDFNAQAELPE